MMGMKGDMMGMKGDMMGKGKKGPSSGGRGPDVMQELGRFSGTIKSFNAQNGYGFIVCNDLKEQGFQDVFLHHAQLGGFEVGSQVVFTAFLTKKGQAQGKDLEAYTGELGAITSSDWVSAKKQKL